MIKKFLRPIIVFIIIIVFLFISKIVYEEYNRTYCPGVIRKSELILPEYKNVKQLILKREDKKGEYYMKEFEFTTTDSPDIVISYYKNVLQNSGWKLIN